MCTNGNPHVVNHTSTIDRHSPSKPKAESGVQLAAGVPAQIVLRGAGGAD